MLDKIITKKKNGKNQIFKSFINGFDKFWFLNFVDISIEKFAGINFAIVVAQI